MCDVCGVFGVCGLPCASAIVLVVKYLVAKEQDTAGSGKGGRLRLSLCDSRWLMITSQACSDAA